MPRARRSAAEAYSHPLTQGYPELYEVCYS